MASKYFFVFIITLAYLTQPILSAAGWCYQCDSRDPNCLISIDTVAMAYHKTPCNGQCYIRVKGSLMSRGCSWEYGYMQTQVSYRALFDQDAMWIFCDTALCNANANTSA
ncbi:unnamed protein product [Adineta steineri]|uniref:DUF753 domain-containing protein n=3 Tax=Adineta steineri TaxID=433720 RepID=A0A818N3X3_9BILA|nr:unnamed protein product [Adineta steineri]